MIHLLVDSSADFTKDEIDTNHWILAPLVVSIQDKNYRDGKDLFPDEFYKLLTSSTVFPKTSQPSPQEFLTIFEEIKKNGDELICILLSSALSGTYQSAALAKQIVDYDKIYLVDSLLVTVGTQMLVSKAQKMIEEKKEAQEIVDYLEKMKKHVKIFAALDTLEYLSKGGRVTKTTAALGNMANIKPIVTVDEKGKVDVCAKRLGCNKATSYILETLSEYTLHPEFQIKTLFTFGVDSAEKLEEKLDKKGYTKENRVQVGPAIGTHIGPGAFGLCFVEAF